MNSLLEQVIGGGAQQTPPNPIMALLAALRGVPQTVGFNDVSGNFGHPGGSGPGPEQVVGTAFGHPGGGGPGPNQLPKPTVSPPVTSGVGSSSAPRYQPPRASLGPGSMITSPFRHLFNQAQINAYGMRQPEVMYSVDRNGNLVSGSRDWWKPGSQMKWGPVASSDQREHD